MSTPNHADPTRWLPPPLAQRTGFLLSKVADAAREAFDHALAPLGLTRRTYGVLTVLATEGPLVQQVLGARVRLDRTTMVAVVDMLEERGLVARTRHAQDRRAYDITITDAGRALLPQLDALATMVEDAVFAPLDATQRQQLHDLLTHLVHPPHREERI